MKIKIILFLLLLIPIIYAEEEYSHYESMSLLYSTSSDINLYSTGNDPKLMDLTVKLNLIPKEDYRQTILSQEVMMKPSTYYNLDNILEIKWQNVNVDYIYYELATRLLTKSTISRVGNVKFPIHEDLGDLSKYTKETDFIDLNENIKKKANEIVEGETDLFVAVYKLAEWTRSNIKYDMNTMTENMVQKSSWVFANKKGVCDEITNLFISFCRSLGIPAKFITGVAYSNIINNFGNHGWAEVYFPGYDWVPFDVTYGEYGWIDATHIKLDEEKDSNVFSVNYNWKSRDLDVKTKDLETKTTVINTGDKITPLTRLEINLLEDDVGFGSYVPIQVIVENLRSNYVADKIYLTKAPEVIGENTKVVLLKPNEIKEEYWLVYIPAMSKQYKYSSLINVNSAFGAIASDSINFDDDGEIISKAEAEAKIEKLRKREDKKFFLNLDFKCNLLKEKYYSNENVEILCNLKNLGNALLKNLQVCLREDCKMFDLGISEEKQVEFESYAAKKVSIIAENENMIKHVYLEPEIIEVPEFEIKNLEPSEIDYKEKKEFSFNLETDYDAYDVDVVVEDKKTHFDLFHGKRAVEVELSGSKLVNGLDIKINYKDKEGKEYTKKEKLDVIVNNIPWYAKIFRFFSMI